MKRTDKHMIIVTYELRPRLFVEPTNNDYIEWYKMLNKNSFTSWLQKQGIGPENTAGNEHEEGERLREEIEARTTPDADAYDHPKDVTYFTISVVNRRNQALSVDCKVTDGVVVFNYWTLHMHDGISEAQQTWIDWCRRPLSRRLYAGPRHPALSEPLQNGLVAYLYSVGVRPEIGAVVEYLSWNKEQRLYMDWLKRLYFGVIPAEMQTDALLDSAGEERLEEGNAKD